MFWKALTSIAHHLIWLPVVILLWLVIANENKRGIAKTIDKHRIGFTPGRLAFWGRPLLGAWLVCWSVYYALHTNGQASQLLYYVASAILGLTLLFSSPGTIIVSDEGMAQDHWYWRKKFIPWNQIAEIRTGKGGGAVTVVSANGAKVIHAPPLADRRRFMQEIAKHCSDNLPPEFPGEI